MVKRTAILRLVRPEIQENGDALAHLSAEVLRQLANQFYRYGLRHALLGGQQHHAFRYRLALGICKTRQVTYGGDYT